MKNLLLWIGMKLCDFGLFTLSLGPKDLEDKELERQLVQQWKRFKKAKGGGG